VIANWLEQLRVVPDSATPLKQEYAAVSVRDGVIQVSAVFVHDAEAASAVQRLSGTRLG
jgi:hypothetical protein